MISFNEAFQTVMNSGFKTGSELIAFTDSSIRVLAEDVYSDIDMPSFNKSAVDGYACDKSDLGSELEMLEIIAAGKKPEKSIGNEQCSKIMTGAAVPPGADFVFMVEDSVLTASGKVKFTGTSLKDNIIPKASHVRAGDVVLRSGRRIRPQDIAVMASVGHVNVSVSVQPTVGVISTGSELTEPQDIPGDYLIRNSNAYQLLSQIERAGGKGNYYGIVKDDETATYNIIKKVVGENNLVIITGGVSMGDFDFVPGILEKAGVKILFSEVAVQPGKPTTFGVHPDSIVFGLPGNPVSSFIQFELLVKPLISIMMGLEWLPVESRLPLKETITRKSVSRMAWLPVVVTSEGFAELVEYHGSGDISALSDADGIISVPVGKATIMKGEMVVVRHI